MTDTMSVNELADMIDPRAAQLAVARSMVAMGAQPEWDSETIEHVADAIEAAAPASLPSFTANLDDEDATDFWQSITAPDVHA